jgi:hypothetical protein
MNFARAACVAFARAENITEELRLNGTIDAPLKAAAPFLFFIAAITACRALERDVAELSGTLGLMPACFAVGTAFNVLNARTIRAKHIDDESATRQAGLRSQK